MKKPVVNIIALLSSVLMIFGISGCVPEPVTTTETDTVTSSQTITFTSMLTDTATVTETSTIITTIKDDTIPMVCVSNNDYSWGDAVSFSRKAEEQELSYYSVSKAISNKQNFIDSATAKAGELGLDYENLEDILTKLLFDIGQLDLKDKNVINGTTITFMLSSKTVQLPYLIEKADYQGQEAWIIALNWEMNHSPPDSFIGHIATIVFEYGTDNVLFAASCG